MYYVKNIFSTIENLFMDTMLTRNNQIFRVFCDKISHSTTSETFTHRLVQIQSFKETLILGTFNGLAFMNKDMKLCKLDATSLVSKSRMIRYVANLGDSFFRRLAIYVFMAFFY